jgi:SMI1 / KNR4 family (SUKH-1)
MKKVRPKNPFAVTDARAKPATESQVQKLERRLGAKLPDDYRRFLLTINGGSREGSWDLPKHGLCVTAFYGLRSDFYDLAAVIDRSPGAEADAGHFPADTIPIVDELADTPILMKYRGRDAGSVWFWDERGDGNWRKIAPSFDAFLAKLHQRSEPQGVAALRPIIERDDVAAARRYLDSLPAGKLDEPIEGDTLLQRAANAGAAKVVALLLDRGARSVAGLGVVNASRHAKVIELLLTRGYKPTQYDWQGAAAFAGPAVLRLYFEHAPPPSRTLLQQLVRNSNNVMKTKPSKEREEIIRMLEGRLASATKTRGSVRNRNGRAKS